VFPALGKARGFTTHEIPAGVLMIVPNPSDRSSIAIVSTAEQ